MLKRLKNAINALLGKEGNCSCGSSCSCEHNDGIDASAIVGVELDKLTPEEQELLKSIMQPIGTPLEGEDEEECDCEEEEKPECGDPTSQDHPCIHMQVKFVCLCHDGDAKPTNCSANTCPARAQMQMLAEIAEREGLRFYN